MPPIELHHILYFFLLQPLGKTQGDKIDGSVSQTFNSRGIKVVIVTVADQDSMDRRELFERNPRRRDPIHLQKRVGSAIITEYGIGQDVDPFDLDKKG